MSLPGPRFEIFHVPPGTTIPLRDGTRVTARGYYVLGVRDTHTGCCTEVTLTRGWLGYIVRGQDVPPDCPRPKNPYDTRVRRVPAPKRPVVVPWADFARAAGEDAALLDADEIRFGAT